MPLDETARLCPEEALAALLVQLQQDSSSGTARLDELTRRFDGDARLHFLKGSMLAGSGDYPRARDEMRRAVDLAPDFAIARFQLGFLLLTSAEPITAQEAWGPLHGLPARHYLRHFVQGLCHLIRDEFGETIRELELGIAVNQENPPLNNDMRLILAEVRKKPLTNPNGPAEASSAQLLLQQAMLRSTRH